MTSPNDLSFLPDDYLAKKARKRANILCAALSVVVMGTIGSAFWLSERSMRDLDGQLADVEGRYSQATDQIAAVKKMHKKQQQIVQHAELATALVETHTAEQCAGDVHELAAAGRFAAGTGDGVEAEAAAGGPGSANAFEARVAAAPQKKAATTNDPPKYDVYIQRHRRRGQRCAGRRVHQQVDQVAADEGREPGHQRHDVAQKDKSNLRRFQLEMMLNPAAAVDDGRESATADVGK